MLSQPAGVPWNTDTERAPTMRHRTSGKANTMKKCGPPSSPATTHRNTTTGVGGKGGAKGHNWTNTRSPQYQTYLKWRPA